MDFAASSAVNFPMIRASLRLLAHLKWSLTHPLHVCRSARTAMVHLTTNLMLETRT